MDIHKKSINIFVSRCICKSTITLVNWHRFLSSYDGSRINNLTIWNKILHVVYYINWFNVNAFAANWLFKSDAISFHIQQTVIQQKKTNNYKQKSFIFYAIKRQNIRLSVFKYIYSLQLNKKRNNLNLDRKLY